MLKYTFIYTFQGWSLDNITLLLKARSEALNLFLRNQTQRKSLSPSAVSLSSSRSNYLPGASGSTGRQLVIYLLVYSISIFLSGISIKYIYISIKYLFFHLVFLSLYLFLYLYVYLVYLSFYIVYLSLFLYSISFFVYSIPIFILNSISFFLYSISLFLYNIISLCLSSILSYYTLFIYLSIWYIKTSSIFYREQKKIL